MNVNPPALHSLGNYSRNIGSQLISDVKAKTIQVKVMIEMIKPHA